ncbi:hypothetical protein GEMRC1_008386 [Eukaryota sp. GEM-RC1]
MLSIPSTNNIVHKSLSGWASSENPFPVSVSVQEYYGFTYSLLATVKQPQSLLFNIEADCLKLGFPSSFQLNQYLASTFPDMVMEADNNIVIVIDHSKLRENEDPKSLISLLSSIHVLVLGLPIVRAIETVEKKETGKSFLKFTSDHIMFVESHRDSILVTFALSIQDSNDDVLVRPFLQELVDARKTATYDSSPPVSWSLTCPVTLEDDVKNNGLKPTHGFITFVIFPKHWVETKRFNTISTLVSFKSFLLLHLRAMKAEQHVRLRKRFSSSLESLNKAKPSVK